MDLFDSLQGYDDELAAWLLKLDASGPLSAEQQQRRKAVQTARGKVRTAIDTLNDVDIDGASAALRASATAVQGVTADLTKLAGTIAETQKVLAAIGTVAGIVAQVAGAVVPIL